MNYKSLILATLLLPSLCVCQTKEEKTHVVLRDMCTLMLKMMRSHHAMIVSIWASGAENEEFSEKMRQEGIAMYKQAGELINKIEELSHE